MAQRKASRGKKPRAKAARTRTRTVRKAAPKKAAPKKAAARRAAPAGASRRIAELEAEIRRLREELQRLGADRQGSSVVDTEAEGEPVPDDDEDDIPTLGL